MNTQIAMLRPVAGTRYRIRRDAPGRWVGEGSTNEGRSWYLIGDAPTHAKAVECMDNVVAKSGGAS